MLQTSIFSKMDNVQRFHSFFCRLGSHAVIQEFVNIAEDEANNRFS